jgi:hypothetical protein
MHLRNDRLPKQAFKYHPRRKRDPGRLRSRWKLKDAATGPNGPNPRSQKKKKRKKYGALFNSSIRMCF